MHLVQTLTPKSQSITPSDGVPLTFGKARFGLALGCSVYVARWPHSVREWLGITLLTRGIDTYRQLRIEQVADRLA